MNSSLANARVIIKLDFTDDFRPEVASNVISGVAGYITWIGVDVRVEFGDSGSNLSRDTRADHFVTDERNR